MKNSSAQVRRISEINVLSDIFTDDFVRNIAEYLVENYPQYNEKYPRLLSAFFSTLTKKILDSKISLEKIITEVRESQSRNKVAYINQLSRHSDEGTFILQRIFGTALSQQVVILSDESNLTQETVFSTIAIVLSYVIDGITKSINAYDQNFEILSSLITISLKAKYLEEDGKGLLKTFSPRNVLTYTPNIIVLVLLMVSVFYYIYLNNLHLQKFNSGILGDSPLDENVVDVRDRSKVVEKVIFSK